MERIELILLFAMAFLPPIIYAIWIRNTEKYYREKWIPVVVCFLWGATIAVLVALILEVVLSIPLAVYIDNNNLFELSTVIIIAPFVEELTKPLALRLKTVKKELSELEDGLIYGAIAGLGFSATENLLYGRYFLTEGLLIFFVLMALRSFGGCLLHASATSWTGYGYGKAIIKHKRLIRALPYFIFAILIHAAYNFFLSVEIMTGAALGLLISFSIVIISIHLVRKKIKTLDLRN